MCLILNLNVNVQIVQQYGAAVCEARRPRVNLLCQFSWHLFVMLKMFGSLQTAN